MTILDKIVDTKRDEIASAKFRRSLAELKREAVDCAPCREFIAPFCISPHPALSHKGRGSRDPDPLRIIAEIKKASPSAGIIRKDFDPVKIAKAYYNGGASALSVLTDTSYFQGNLAYLKHVRDVVPLPALRKDFIIDPYQIYESRVAGADAILLIATLLEPAQIADDLALANELGLAVLVELHDEEDLAKVNGLQGEYLLGVNNRDLKTFKVSLEVSRTLAKRLPAGRPWVSESGLSTREDLLQLAAIGYSGFLVGESLMREKNSEAALKKLISA